jgi:hypothetical protein
MKCATIVAQDHPHRVKADWILRGLGALAPGYVLVRCWAISPTSRRSRKCSASVRPTGWKQLQPDDIFR